MKEQQEKPLCQMCVDDLRFLRANMMLKKATLERRIKKINMAIANKQYDEDARNKK